MKVLLTNPVNRTSIGGHCDIGLGYLASSLRAAGHTPMLHLRSSRPADFMDLLDQERPAVVGIKIMSTNVREAIDTIELVRKTIDCTVVVGGPHVSGEGGRILEYVPCDFAFTGEADRAFPRFLSALEKNADPLSFPEFPGLCWREGKSVHANTPDLIDDLDGLPFPAWDLMPPARHKALVSRNVPAAEIMVTRGCTNNCAYCFEGGRRLRRRSVNNVMAEISLLVGEYGVREIQFLDSNFMFSPPHVRELCKRITEMKWGISLCAPNGMRVNALDEATVEALAAAGFYRTNLGIESGCSEVLKRMNKACDPSLFREKVMLLRKHGIMVIGNFMLGFPGETKKQMDETLALALDLDLTGANFSILVPFPGTPLARSLPDEGGTHDADNFLFWNCVAYENGLSALSPHELKRFRNWCVLRFLLRWRILKGLAIMLLDRNLRNGIARRLNEMYVQPFIVGVKVRLRSANTLC